MINRYIQLPELAGKKSAFLFGPRSTGKSFWIKHQLGDPPYIDLLKASESRRYIADPSLIRQVASAYPGSLIVIDEIHSIIEETGTLFLLTGSSARKLKRSGANMLGGRARIANLFPLTWKEWKKDIFIKTKILSRNPWLPRTISTIAGLPILPENEKMIL